MLVAKNSVILTGKKQIVAFTGRSWATICKWIRKDGFPARKIDGVWEADADLIVDWRRERIVGDTQNTL